MNGKILSVVSIFIASLVIGYNMLSPTQVVQASPPVFISPVELMSSMNMKTPVEQIDVEINLETQEVSVNGATGNKVVNVRTTGKAKADTVVKWRTKVKEKVVRDGFPRVKAMMEVHEEATSPFKEYE